MDYRDHSDNPRKMLALRTRAVRAVVNGEKKIDVARRHGITRQTLHNWVTKYRLGGTNALVGKQRGRIRRRVLESWQAAQVAGAIRILPPRTVNPRYTRWTKRAISEYVEKSFGVSFNAWQVDSHLRHWGFESHKEVRRAYMDNQVRDGAPNWAIQGPAETALQDATRESEKGGGIRRERRVQRA